MCDKVSSLLARVRVCNGNPTFYIVDFALDFIQRYYTNCRDALQCVSTLVQVANPKSSLGQALNPPGAGGVNRIHQYGKNSSYIFFDRMNGIYKILWPLVFLCHYPVFPFNPLLPTNFFFRFLFV